MSEEKQARLTVNVDAVVYKKLRMKAMEKNSDITGLVREWIDKYISEEDK